jgi:hypothetical protein
MWILLGFEHHVAGPVVPALAGSRFGHYAPRQHVLTPTGPRHQQEAWKLPVLLGAHSLPCN